MKQEFMTKPIIEAIWQANKTCYVPILASKNTLRFVKYTPTDTLHLNHYGILEPAHPAQELPIAALDLVLTPLVAFDHQGHRLGAGGGYYDRTFQDKQSTDKPHFIGLAYAAQEAAALPADPWDIHLEGVITEKGFKVC